MVLTNSTRTRFGVAAARATTNPGPPPDHHRGRRWAVLVLGVVVLAALSGCASPAAPSVAPSSTAVSAPSGEQPVATSVADWAGVRDVLGRPGTLSGTVFRVPLPRSDLAVTSEGVAIKPGLSLGGYAAFTRYPEITMLMGDLVVTEAELPTLTDALRAAGIAQTALHKHLLEQNPPLWWTHVHAMGDPMQLARGLAAALKLTATPPATPLATGPGATQPPVKLDTAGIDAALGRTGTADGGIYKISIARGETIVDEGHVLPAGLGVTTGINFQPLGGGNAATNGDIAMTADEVQNVISALRHGGIQVVSVHNHGLTEQPRLFYLHFWAVNDAVSLARALRPALDATHLKPAS